MSNRKKIVFFALVTIIVATRVIGLGSRPLHHDEANNFHFANIILETGLFTYDPLNYHGPLYFFILFLSFAIFGISEISLRMPGALLGMGLAILPFFIKNKTNYWNIAAILIITLSPSLSYFSRYAIHESLFVLLTIIFVLLLSRLIEKKDVKYLPYLAVIAALMVATKETASLVFAAAAVMCVAGHKNLRQIEWRKYRTTLLASFYLFIILHTALYTSFFTNFKGYADSFRAYLPWLERSHTDIGHFKPWHYYLALMAAYEAPLLILGALGFIAGKILKNTFIQNLGILFALQLIVYSILPYKMPWLVINFTAPLCLLAAYGLAWIPWKKIRLGVTAMTVIFLGFFYFHVNFITPWQESNWYAYAHTDANTLELVKAAKKNTTAASRIAMVSDVYWPLPFYLRGYAVDYYHGAQSFDLADYSEYDAIIISDKIFDRPTSSEFVAERFTLRNNVFLWLLYRRAE